MAGDGELFRMKFRLVGFDTEKEDEYRSLIRKGGGKIDLKYEWKGLYLITSNDTVRYADQICVDARNNGGVVLNEFWLEDTLASRSIANTRNVLYQPPLSLDGVKGAGHLLIAQSGFSPKESGNIKRLIELIGASQAKEDEVSKSSYLICCKPEGEDYITARAKDVFTVNKKWIEDCVIEWDIVSVDHYISWPQDQQTAKGQASGSQKTPSKMEIDMNIGRKDYCKERKVNTEPRESRKRSAEPKNTCKRQALWTAPSCRRSLFNRRSLSDSKRSDLIVKVQIPRSRLEIDVGTDDIKRFLLASYASLVNIIVEGECIKNQFDSNCFQMLLGSDQVKIELVQLVPFTEELAISNKKQFVLMVQKLYRDNGCRVPDDIAGWLSSIAARVPDRVLKQHVNMLGRTEIFGTFVSIYYALLGLKRNDLVSYNQDNNSKELSTIYIDWEKIPFSWIVFHDCLTYIHPRQLEVYRLRCQQNSGQPICQPKPKKRDSNVFGLTELIRDCFFHPALDYQSMLLPVLLLTDYPGLLADLQQLLSALGHLK